ncbi:MAG: rod-binding protein [Alphaproteobacteria bacterium]
MIDSPSTLPFASHQPAPPRPQAQPGDTAGAAKAAQEFEAFVIGEFVDVMFQGIEEDPMFGGGSGGQMFKSLLHREYANEIAASGGFGIADAVTAELLRAQENAR